MDTSEIVFFFFFNDTATTEIYTLSLHDALPIFPRAGLVLEVREAIAEVAGEVEGAAKSSVGRKKRDRKSTRLNSSHANISYAVFCLKKKKQISLIPSLS